ncbi:MAG: hypothetical protein LBR83_03550 [Clostridiales bacterium]|nr:hypothetical protein [Clostridiales bacterium]
MLKKMCKMKDIIALLIVVTFCLSIFLPEYFVSDETMTQLERILCTIIGFYFGTHIAENGRERDANPAP